MNKGTQSGVTLIVTRLGDNNQRFTVGPFATESAAAQYASLLMRRTGSTGMASETVPHYEQLPAQFVIALTREEREWLYGQLNQLPARQPHHAVDLINKIAEVKPS